MPNTTTLARLGAPLLRAWMASLWALIWCCGAAGQTATTQANTVALLLPGGVAYDSGGNLYLADTGRNVLLKVTTAGVLTTVAGTGVQGFDGDGAAATAALLDGPAGVALDGKGNLYVADSHNHRIRRVDSVSGVMTTFAGTGVAGSSPNGMAAGRAEMDLPTALTFNAAGDLFYADSRAHLIRRIDHASGLVTTVAGNGTQGYSGDGGLATAASVDGPEGLAVDSAGDLYVSDTHNDRVRRVDAGTGLITTVAGTGVAGFSGDGGAASTAAIRFPRGLTLDGAGNVLVVDSQNHRLRRLGAANGQMSTLAGDGTQGFAGDAGPAGAASLNSPRAVALAAGGLPTLSDSGNARVRQVDAAAVIRTIAGLGSTSAGVLTLAAPSVTAYGSGSVMATLAASPASGSVTFFDGGTGTLGTFPLRANTAAFPLGALAVGKHQISATYTGDASHGAAQSGIASVAIVAASLTATPNPVNLVYGQALPGLTGLLSGELPQDTAAGSVTLNLQTSAGMFSPPGSYPITASVIGAAAGNYTLSTTPAAVTIGKASSVVALTSGLAVHVAPATAGTATGTVALLDGSQTVQTGTLSSGGDVAFSLSSLPAGSHTLVANYGGDGNLLASSSAPVAVVTGPSTTPDFALAGAGATAVTVSGGTAAQFSFATTLLNGGLASPIQLTVTGVPVGATASFSPAYLPPASAGQTFVLTIQTAKVAGLSVKDALIYACLIPLCLLARRRRVWPAIAVTAFAVAGMGCGDRVNTTSARATAAQTYNLTVIGTGTAANGAPVQHSVAVTLTVE